MHSAPLRARFGAAASGPADARPNLPRAGVRKGPDPAAAPPKHKEDTLPGGRTIPLALVALALFASGCNPGATVARRLQASCAAGSAAACDTLAQQVARGDHVLRDWRRAGALYQQACDGNDGSACVRLAGLHLRDDAGEHGIARDSMMAAGLLDRGCDLGSMPGCVTLGDMYLQKDTVVKNAKVTGPLQDVPHAIALYRRACDGDGRDGCDRLGDASRNGTGLPADPMRAAQFYERACGSGYQLGCAHLGEAYVAGAGVRADPTRASALFEKACETEMTGCFDLAGLLEHGTGVTRDYDRAVKLYRKACSGTRTRNGGSDPVAESCYRLGNMYANATGVERNLGRASAFFYRACALGYTAACRKRS